MAEKTALICYYKINLLKHVLLWDAVVKELLTRAGESGSTPGNAVFVSFFSVKSLFFNPIFPLSLLSFILTVDPADHALGINIYFIF